MLSNLIPNYGDTKNQEVRIKYGKLEAWVSIFGNVFLFAVKFLIGILIVSVSLIADAVHTLSDFATSVVVLFGFKACEKKPDEEHPFGHGRAEHIATLIIAILLIIVGVYFAYESLQRVLFAFGFSQFKVELINLQGQNVLLIVILLLFFAFAKELMAKFSFVLGEKIESNTLKVDAWHHRSDAFATLLVVFAIIGSAFGYNYLDGIFGVAISILIIYIGYDFAKESSDLLLGKMPKETKDKIYKIVKCIEGVKGVKEVQIHDYGNAKFVSLRIEVEKNLSAENGHKIANAVEEKIKNEVNCSTIVHIEPGKLSINKGKIEEIVKSVVKKHRRVKSCHEISVSHDGINGKIEMHIIVDGDMKVEEGHKLSHEVVSLVQNKYKNFAVNVHVEPCIGKCEVREEKCE